MKIQIDLDRKTKNMCSSKQKVARAPMVPVPMAKTEEKKAKVIDPAD